MMFGWTKKEKNDKLKHRARAEMNKLSPKAKGERLSRLRKRYPNRRDVGIYDFDMELFDYELVFMYLLLCDDTAVEEADMYDNPVEDVEESMEDAGELVEAEVIEEAVTAEVESEPVAETPSFDPTPVKSTPSYSPEPIRSFDSDTDTSSYGGGGGDSFDSSDDGGGGDD